MPTREELIQAVQAKRKREDLVAQVKAKREASGEGVQSPSKLAGNPLEAGIEGFGETATMGYLPRAQAGVGAALGLGEYDKLLQEYRQRGKNLNESNPVASNVGKAAGIGATLLVPGAAAESLGGAAGRAALQGAAYDTGKNLLSPDDLKQRAEAAALSGVTGSAGYGLGKLLGKVGDVGMQMSVGRKKYTPGVGQALAEEGIMGTRGQMQEQVENALKSKGKEISDIAKSIPAGSIDASKISKEVQVDSLRPFLIPGGAKPSSADVEKISAIKGFAEDIAGRGVESGEQALARRVAAGQRSYGGRENPLLSMLSQMSKKEQQGYSEALKKAAGKALDKPDFAYGALKRAQKSLNEETQLPRSMLGGAAFKLSQLPGVPLIGSALSRGAIGASQAVSPAEEALRRSLLETVRQK